METKKTHPISFELKPNEKKSLELLAGTRKVRLSGQIRRGRLVIDNVSFAEEGQVFPSADFAFKAVNAPFKVAAMEKQVATA